MSVTGFFFFSITLFVGFSLQGALGGCRPSQVQIYQGSTGFGPGHVPKFTVNIINESPESKVFHDIHVACGDFASTTLINPKIFRRLAPGDCLLKDGKEFNPGEIIAFDYTNLFSYKLVPSQVKC